MTNKKGSDIEKQSFTIIDTEIGSTSFSNEEYTIVRRIIHATGDFDFARTIRFHKDAVTKGVQAIRQGKNILADVRMVEAGINKKALSQWGGKVICLIDSEEVVSTAHSKGRTRAETAMEKGMADNIGIVAIGNAPTALLSILETMKSHAPAFDLVIGVPVGFVNASESKEALSNQSHPFITTLGRKGGSPVAVAIINSLLKLA
ncbi:MAG TPA: precorrin-8X methylmutase [Thermodesulfovibrionia bacterium]|nr:precorrin-8X methylmutase [Thermodesulfovibrionia bacterium]